MDTARRLTVAAIAVPRMLRRIPPGMLRITDTVAILEFQTGAVAQHAVPPADPPVVGAATALQNRLAPASRFRIRFPAEIETTTKAATARSMDQTMTVGLTIVSL